MRRMLRLWMTIILALVFSVGTAGVSDAQIARLLQLRQSPPPPPPQKQSPPPQSAPAPPPSDSGGGKRIVYSVSAQQVWLYEGGNLLKNYPVSGRKGFPSAGTYEVFSKSPWATNGKVRMQWMVRFVPGGKGGMATGFHAIPVTQSGEPIQSESELGQYRSKGCVRQRVSDAEHLYHWADLGTAVEVHG